MKTTDDVFDRNKIYEVVLKPDFEEHILNEFMLLWYDCKATKGECKRIIEKLNAEFPDLEFEIKTRIYDDVAKNFI